MTILTLASIDNYLKWLSAHGGSDNTRRAYQTDLTSLISWLAEQEERPTTWPDLENQAALFLTAHRTAWAPRTLNRRLASLRSWARHNGQPTFLSGYRAPTAAPAMPHPIPEGTEGVVRMIESVRARRSPHHRALVALTGLCGLRVEEAVRVRAIDFRLRDDGRWLRVYGKGSKERDVPITDKAWEYLERAVEEAAMTGATVAKLTNRGARAAIARHARAAGLSRPVAAHDLRHTAATAFYGVTGDLRAVQGLLGHGSSQTTEGYVAVTAAQLRTAAGGA